MDSCHFACPDSGERSLFTMDPSVAYGVAGAGWKIPPNATVKFDIELLGWETRLKELEYVQRQFFGAKIGARSLFMKPPWFVGATSAGHTKSSRVICQPGPPPSIGAGG